jgi:Concanavalin A-like lectin/glucanases superfamily/IPT/TIG domain
MQYRSSASLIVSFAVCCLVVAQNQAISLTPPGPPFDYVLVANPASLVPPTGVTMEAWVYPLGASPPGSTRCIVRRDDGNATYSLYFYLSAANPAFHFRTSVGIQGVLSTSTVPIGEWTHLAATYDNATARIYMNGVELASEPASGPMVDVGGPYFEIGTPGLWNGQLDAVRIWSRARTADQIQAGMRYQLEDQWGLLASWHFDGDYLDSTGNHHGTPSGVPTFVPGTAPLLPNLRSPIQVATGSPLDFRIAAVSTPVSYLLEISEAGTSPGLPLPAPLMGVFPLNPPLLFTALSPVYPDLFHGFTGTTDASGVAFASIDVPALPALEGIALSAAFVTLDPAGPFGIGSVSNPVTTGIAAAPPQVASIDPATAPTEGGTSITITGTGFLDGAAVFFGALAATNVVVVSPTTITCVSPPGPLGPASVTVLNPEFSDSVANGLFAYVATLVISGISPQIGPAGSLAVVSGSGFQPGLTVAVAGALATVVNVTPSAVTFVRPPGVACDAILTVANPDGQSGTATLNSSPSLSDLVPPFGAMAGGNPAFLIGTGFVPGTTVTVGGQPATVLNVSPTSLLFVVPAGGPGIAPVVATLPSGCASSMEYLYQ